jgi:hypothetical protein
MAAGTILTSFATTLNNHTVAARCLRGVALAWRGRSGRAGLWVGSRRAST